jgi:hypothetical protein
MAIGAYDRPAESNIINTYVPLPFDAIVQAGAARQGRYDAAQQSMDAAEDYLDQIQAIEGAHENYLNNAKSKYNNIATKYANKDLSQSYIRRQFKDDIKRNIDPSTINRIVQSRKNYDENKKYKAELAARGLYYEPYDRAMDPALNGSLTPNQLYDYVPMAFQDPEKVAGEYFSKIAPSKRVINRNGMLIEVTSRDLSQLQKAVASDWRTFADTPQGQWVVNQYIANNPGGETDPAKIVQGYMNDVAKRHVIPPQEDYVGYDPYAKARATGKSNSTMGFSPNAITAIPGEGLALPNYETKWKKNRNEIQNLTASIDLVNSTLRNKNISPEARKEQEAMLEELTEKKNRLTRIREDLFTQAGIETDYTKVKTDFDKYNSKLSEKDRATAYDIGLHMYELGTNKAADVDAYITANYPELKGKEKRQMINNAMYKENSVYELFDRNEAGRYEKKQAFKQYSPKSESHPSLLPPISKVEGGVEFLANPYDEGKFNIASEAQQVVKGIQENPQAFKLSLYNGKDFVNMDKDQIEKFNAGSTLHYTAFPLLPNKKGEYELEFRIKDKDDKVSKEIYRVAFSDDSQIDRFANDYFKQSTFFADGNPDDMFSRGYALSHSYIAKTFMAQKDKDVKKIPIQTISGDTTYVKVQKDDDGSYVITDNNDMIIITDLPDGSQQPLRGYTSDEEAVQALLDLQLNNDAGIIKKRNEIINRNQQYSQ